MALVAQLFRVDILVQERPQSLGERGKVVGQLRYFLLAENVR